MWRFTIDRFIQALFCIVAVSAIVFFVTRLSGSVVDLLLSDDATLTDQARLTQALGLDKPLIVQYWVFLSHAAIGDFGMSIRAARPAMEVVLERFPATLQLGGSAVLVCVFIALPVGVYAAVKRGSFLDMIGRGFAVFGQAAPVFWVGIMMIWIFAVNLRLLPAGGRGGIENLILPAITLGWYTGAGIMRLTRSSMLDVLGSEYVKFAILKGVPPHLVVWKHAFKNAALPVLTFAVVLFVILLHGTVLIETVFGWPGVGRLAIDSIKNRDYPVAQTVVMVFSVMFIMGNFVVDILYGYLNPKIRYRK
ncbi:ABC transporter permease [Chloroflexota bacterium]